MKPVLIDTCAWIDFLRQPQGSLGDQVAQLLASDRAALCGAVQAELMQGAKGRKEQEQLDFLLANVPCLDIIPADWLSAGRLLAQLRAKGLQVPLSDALIAVCARRHQAPVLTLDQHFQHLDVVLL
ncbi:PIN domain-containing protein [Rhodoferax sp.]|uniref:type II toxin-antitoxin system VapC family toxin n=1 Tax=Rhodoferax sp. TaxID=50421 RepID=UPI0025FE1DC6|nr:PIN domain-containing protein [Rhodoferax sp.]